MIGLSTGVKQGESQVLFAADMTASAFMRTDYNLVDWMADVAGFHKQAGGGKQLCILPHRFTDLVLGCATPRAQTHADKLSTDA
jgi:hypothetical protein